jgi:streptogrisin B
MKNTYIFALALSAFFFISSCSEKPLEVSENKEVSEAQINVNQFESNMDKPEASADFQLKAIEYHQKIEETFKKGQNSEDDFSGYPGYYGGAYINPQGKLVIFIKGNSENGKKNLTKIVGSSDFLTEPCKHSYKTLRKVISDLNAFKVNKSNESKFKNFNMYGIVGFSNEVTVELDEFNDAKIAEFKKFVMNSPAIIFRKSSGRGQLEAYQ